MSKEHKVTITIKGSPNSSKVDMSMKFSPAIQQKDPKKSNCLEGVAAKIIRAVTKQ